MPGGVLRNLGLSLPLPEDRLSEMGEDEEGTAERTLMNLTTFFLVS